MAAIGIRQASWINFDVINRIRITENNACKGAPAAIPVSYP